MEWSHLLVFLYPCTLYPFGRIFSLYEVDLRDDRALPEISQMLQSVLCRRRVLANLNEQLTVLAPLRLSYSCFWNRPAWLGEERDSLQSVHLLPWGIYCVALYVLLVFDLIANEHGRISSKQNVANLDLFIDRSSAVVIASHSSFTTASRMTIATELWEAHWAMKIVTTVACLEFEQRRRCKPHLCLFFVSTIIRFCALHLHCL